MLTPHADLDHPLVEKKLCKYHFLSLYIAADVGKLLRGVSRWREGALEMLGYMQLEKLTVYSIWVDRAA